MNRALQVIVGTVALVIIVVCVALQAGVRIRRHEQFTDPHQVRTAAGTNYVVRLAETTIGRIATGYVLIVHLEVSNPNPTELTLNRNDFILVDQDKDYYQATTTGTQQATIRLPPGGTREREMLSFGVGPEALHGTLGLQIGHYYWVALKNETPYAPQLRPDEFRTFKQTDWHD